MLEEYLVDECKLVSPTRNEYGDYQDTASTVLKCRFREISTMRRTMNQEISDADAQIWFTSSSGVHVGNIILFDGTYYQIERLTKARRLGETEVQFIKCDLKITDIGIS